MRNILLVIFIMGIFALIGYGLSAIAKLFS